MRKPRPQTLVWLASSALASIATEHSRYSAVETGGLLVGYWANGAEVVITDATGGGPLARHGPKAYVPDAAHDAAETARLYTQRAAACTPTSATGTPTRQRAFV